MSRKDGRGLRQPALVNHAASHLGASRFDPARELEEKLNNASPEQVALANAAVIANLNSDGSPKYGSAQGYACALTAIMGLGEISHE